MSENRPYPGGRNPDVIIHKSLAQNLYRRLSATPSGPSMRAGPGVMPALASRNAPPPSARSAVVPPVSSANSSTASLVTSPSGRDRSRSGGQTPREVVWVDSKERLSEMATDIRGISNALSNVALSVAVKNVLIVSKLSDEELPSLTKEMVEWLLKWTPRDPASDSVDDEHPVATRGGDANTGVSSGGQRRDSSTGRDTMNETTGGKVAGSSTSDAGSDTHSTTSSELEPSKDGARAAVNDMFNGVDPTISAGPRPRRRSDKTKATIEPHSCSSGDLIVFVEDELAAKPRFGLADIRRRLPQQCERLKLWSTDDVSPHAESIDLVITLGGDGTVLYTSWLFQKMVPPTLSFGLGSLGFMTENEFEEFPHILDEHLTNGICCTLRMRFECTVMRTRNQHKIGRDDLQHEMRAGAETLQFASHTKDGGYTILNEVVVDRGPNPFVTMTELYGNFELLTSIQADGVVISTPTGSTAYSMSAGGSLVHPDIPAQLISPICPHTLSFRPLVVPDSMILHIGVPYDARSSAFVSFDGKARVELRRGDFLAINVSRYPFPKVLPPRSTSVSWVQQLSRTLHWNEQKRPKRYTEETPPIWSG